MLEAAAPGNGGGRDGRTLFAPAAEAAAAAAAAKQAASHGKQQHEQAAKMEAKMCA